MAARFVYAHPEMMDGLLLWDAYPPDTNDISERGLPVHVIHRSSEDEPMPEPYVEMLPFLPMHTTFSAILGANHLNYGSFIAAPRWHSAPQATIPIDVQQKLIAKASVDFLRSIKRALSG